MPPHDARASDVGCVAIGRNEGDRLVRCLRSLAGRVAHVVYVDSASTDGSAARARELGADVVELDLSIPFTAARARNEGFARLREIAPELRYVQFVDGDCEVVEGWLETARARLEQDRSLAVVCGRRRERFKDASVWNRIIDVEWDTPVGEASACGGDAMMRIDAFVEVGGFDGSLIAGEEPELCVRLRRAGHRIERLDAEMTLHDAAMTHVSQWWKRTVRAGHAFAEGAALHGASEQRHWVQETRRIFFWGAVVPGIAVGAAVPTLGASLALLAAYPVSASRIYKSTRARGRSRADSAAYAVSVSVGRFAELQGALKYHLGRARGRRSGLIEYK
ncbi:glycosyltransferase [Sandaracinus amylolyticus]|uniref:glycosyltransferase n=1 Tax=Sandaracinus amylolyticus TaxID=927083 RepID=UPI001F195F2D|nr:glycosyltransferase [Sandaracinus amylolyticus]